MGTRILVVDDEPFILRSLTFVLRKEGFDVLEAADGEEAMSTILPESAMKSMGITAEEHAVENIDFDETETYICSECGYAARGFKPTICSVCSAPPEKFQHLDKEAIKSLAPLEGGIEEVETFGGDS